MIKHNSNFLIIFKKVKYAIYLLDKDIEHSFKKSKLKKIKPVVK